MKLLWHDAWMETPGYDVPDRGVLIGLDAAVPLVSIENASGRQTRRPSRKVATFLLTDGPRSTLRKARTKHDEPRFTGDFRISIVLGAQIPSGQRVIALGSRVPPCSAQLVINPKLVLPVEADFSVDDLRRVAAYLVASDDVLTHLCRQNFIYSGMEPPEEAITLLEEAVQSIAERSEQVRPTDLPVLSPPEGSTKAADTVLRLNHTSHSSGGPVAVLGAGDYTRTEIIPALRKARLSLYSVANREPQIAAMVGREYGFALATTDSERAIAELPVPGLVVVATGHDSHAHLACVALDAGHRVFVEKPPAVTANDVLRLAAAMRAHPGFVEIGFNRRYHTLVRRARARLQRESGPSTIFCIIKELTFEPDHWYFWPNQGTRITGNLCHWIDLGVFLLDGNPMPVSVTLSPRKLAAEPGDDEERVLAVTFDDGSLLTILATTRGDDIRGVQELMEIRRGRTTVTIDDLWKMRTRYGGIERYSRTLFRDKAHRAMYREALGRVLAGMPATYPVRDLIVVSAIQIAASDLARTDQQVSGLPDWVAMAADSFDHEVLAAGGSS